MTKTVAMGKQEIVSCRWCHKQCVRTVFDFGEGHTRTEERCQSCSCTSTYTVKPNPGGIGSINGVSFIKSGYIKDEPDS